MSLSFQHYAASLANAEASAPLPSLLPVVFSSNFDGKISNDALRKRLEDLLTTPRSALGNEFSVASDFIRLTEAQSQKGL